MKSGTLVMMVGLLAVAASAVSSFAQDDGFLARICELKHEGVPTSLADLQLPDDSSRSNGAAILGRSLPALKAFEKAMFAFDENLLQMEINREITDLHDRLLEEHPQLFAQLGKAAATEVIFFETNFEEAEFTKYADAVTEHSNQFRSIIRVLMFRARVLAANGDADDACAVVSQMFAFSRHADEQPFFVSALIANACHRMTLLTLADVLREVELVEEQRQLADQQLAGYERFTIQTAIETERAYGLMQIHSQPVRVRLDLLDYWEFQHGLAGTTFAGYVKTLQAMDADEIKRMRRHPLIAMLEPSVLQLRQSKTEVLGVARCVRLLNRIQQRAPNADRIDTSKLGLPEKVILDPLTDKPIEVAKVKDGWRISFSADSIQPPAEDE